MSFTEHWQAVKSANEPVERLTKALQSSITCWRFGPVVDVLLALRGVAKIAAIGLVTEIGDLAHFSHPHEVCTGYGQMTRLGNRILARSSW